MRILDTKCPNCGANLKVDLTTNQAVCDYCRSSFLVDDGVLHIQYDNVEDAGYQFEKGRQRAQFEAHNENYKPVIKKKRRTWLWVLGWIFIFPLPLTLLMIRNQKLNKWLRIGIIAIAWILYFIIAFAGNSSNTTEKSLSGNIKEISFLNDKEVTLKVGEISSGSYAKVSVKSTDTFSHDDILFVSENPEIATISFDYDALTTYLYYNITGVGPGETSVYVSNKDGSVVSEFIKVTVLKPIEPEGISVTVEKSELVVGESVIASASILPVDAENQSISWSSSDTTVAIVDDTGAVTGVGNGVATITAKTANELVSSFEVSVDGSRRLMDLKVTYPRQDDNNIGDDWSFVTEINGERTSNSIVLSAGDKIKCWAEFTESDNDPDVGEASTSYTVTEDDLDNGFSITMDLYVRENGGKNSGQRAYFIVSYIFS